MFSQLKNKSSTTIFNYQTKYKFNFVNINYFFKITFQINLDGQIFCLFSKYHLKSSQVDFSIAFFHLFSIFNKKLSSSNIFSVK